MGKIFVHIGLPKTATSTLQTDVFPALQDDKLTYLGVDGERRERASSALYYQFMDAVESSQGIDGVKEMLRKHSQDNDLLLSEELLTVSSKSVPWQIKLERVAEILSGLDYMIIISVRDPVSALFSYYVELFPRFSNIRFVECAMSHNDMLIFHYAKLLAVLSQAFEIERLFFVKFEDISKNKIDLMLNVLIGDRKHLEISYGIHNSKNMSGDKVVSRYKVTPYTLMVAAYRKAGFEQFNSIHKIASYAKRHLMHLDKVVFKPVTISRPTVIELDYLRQQLAEERMALSSRFGISYE